MAAIVDLAGFPRIQPDGTTVYPFAGYHIRRPGPGEPVYEARNHRRVSLVWSVRAGVVVLPKRSPDLNPLDYCIWDEITRRLHAQERAFEAGKRETLAEFSARLRGVAFSLEPAFINKALQGMRRRCTLLHEKKGGHLSID